MTALQPQTVPVPVLDADLDFLDIVTEWDTTTAFHKWRPSIVVPATFRSANTPRTIVVGNQKGGVGKTITSLELAMAFAARGLRTRLIDADPQKAALTVWLRETCYPEVGPRHTLRDVFFGQATLAQATHPTIYRGLYFIPSDPDLSDVESANSSKVLSPETLLRDALRADTGEWDINLFDLGPNLDKISISALIAAQDLVIAIQDGGLEVEGTGNIITTVNSIKERMNPDLALRAIFFTDFKKDSLHRKIGQEMSKGFPDALIVPARESTNAGWSTLNKRPLRMYAPGDKPCLDYDRAAGLLISTDQKAG
ncbi:ParA family protein [Streptomyces sp. NPDC051555]|uniref:ParA family protein n=1 Tax=Streptomyces sp. NPDC051555 TaxID=3365657 RepID=UPI003796C4A8